MRRAGSLALRVVLALLVAIGVYAAGQRAVSVTSDDPTALNLLQIEWVARLAGLSRDSSEYLRLRREIPRSMANLNDHPQVTLWHVLAGGGFFILVPIQFSRSIRARRPALHRWNGRALLALLSASTFAAFGLALAQPYGGAAESAAAFVFGAWLLFCAARGYLAIRRRQVARHREWMLRMFAVGIGISVIRVLAMASLAVFGTEGINPAGFALNLWAGWLLSVAAGELWILRTRPRRAAESDTALQPL